MMVLLALGIVLQDNAAEESFRKIEDTIEKAKTLDFTFQIGWLPREVDSGNVPWSKGSVFLKEGNRVFLQMNTFRKTQSSTFGIVSDGTSMYRPGKLQSSPSTLSAFLRRSITRGGIAESLKSSTLGDPKATSDALTEGISTSVEVKDIRTLDGGDGDSEKVISYQARVSGTSAVHQVKLWFNPKTFQILRITRDEGTYPETCLSFHYNQEVPDEKFSVPQKNQ